MERSVSRGGARVDVGVAVGRDSTTAGIGSEGGNEIRGG